MSSYHSSFTYLKKNSSEEGFIIASFEPDSGFVDSYLGMDQITTNSYDGTKKNFYGSKYNSSAEILITLVKPDGTDFSMADNRKVLRWLTGSRQASWLDLYVNDKLVYSFYGNITACQQQKLDARIIGIQVTFSSLHPWAWSAPQVFNCTIGEKMIRIDDNGAIYNTYEEFEYFGSTNAGLVYNSNNNDSFMFNITDDGVVYNDSSVTLQIDNKSDDLYTLINLNLEYANVNSPTLFIDNMSLEEEPTIITGIGKEEVISLSAGQFIISETFPNRVFGDSFNFIWPKLRPGVNRLLVDGLGLGKLHFMYRYPIKIGDCAIDVESLGRNPMCEGDISGVVGSVDGITTLARKNVMFVDRFNHKPYMAFVKDSYLHIVEADNSRNGSIVLLDGQNNTLHEMTVNNSSIYLSDIVKNNNMSIKDSIVLIDETNNKPYELTVKNDSLYLSEI